MNLFLTVTLIFFLAQTKPTAQAQAPDHQIERVVQLMQSGKMEEAEQTLSKILRSDPRNANALNLLGILRGEQNRPDEAEKLFRQALDIHPKLAGAAVNLGYLYRKMERPEEALSAFTRADKIQPNDPEIQFNIAALHADGGAYSTALAVLEKIPKPDRPPEYALVLARSYLGLGRLEDLRKSLSEMRSMIAQSPGLLAELAQLLISAGLFDDAIAFLQFIEGPAATSFPIAFNLGEANQMKGNLEKAAEFYRTALRAQPHSVETLKRLAVIAQRTGGWEEMFQYLGQAKNLAPNSGSILYGFALAALHTNHLGDAQHSIRQALDLEPENPEYLYFYGITQMSFSDIPPATETFRKYVRLKPQDAMGHLGLAFALYESAQYDEALNALKRCRELKSDLVEPFYYLGMIAHNRGESQRALEYLNQVIARQPNHAAAHSGLGAVYFKLGELDKAKSELELAIKLNPSHATTHYQLSQVLVRLNQREQAEKELKLYAELKAKAEEARSAASRLLATK